MTPVECCGQQNGRFKRHEKRPGTPTLQRILGRMRLVAAVALHRAAHLVSSRPAHSVAYVRPHTRNHLPAHTRARGDWSPASSSALLSDVMRERV